ncbi:MAG: hypothetical protein LQ338_002815 [Usnochroma carphineum]|nr:MAG: hypothetical protein LQ338_002815 [Usnochroma carphineum]
MAALETQRRENIKRNQQHLEELGIYRKHRAVGSAPAQRTSKRRKIFDQQPSRVSARIASATAVPVYVTDSESKNARPNTKSVKAKKAEAWKEVIPPRTQLPAGEVDSLRAVWTDWKPTAPPPTRGEESTFHFESHPGFTPNKSPEEMLREGCFGGSYFRPLYSRKLGITVTDDYKELPLSWIEGLNVNKFLISSQYNPDVNKFKVMCGQSIEEWEAAGWVNHVFDIRGWFQWYCRFLMGRRCDDDDRQVGRWRRCVGDTGRWRRLLLKKYVALGIKEVFDDGEKEERSEVSPVMHQTCFHWALELRQDILDQYWQKGR